MLAGPIGMAILSFAVGLGLIAIGSGLMVPQRLQSAGWFDIAVGVALLLYGAAILETRPSGVWNVFPIFLGYFLAGVVVFRWGCLFSAVQSQQVRDAMTSVVLSFVGAIGMICLTGGRETLLLWLGTPSLLIGGFGMVLFLSYSVLRLRHKRVYQRDVVGALLMILLPILMLFLHQEWVTIYG